MLVHTSRRVFDIVMLTQPIGMRHIIALLGGAAIRRFAQDVKRRGTDSEQGVMKQILHSVQRIQGIGDHEDSGVHPFHHGRTGFRILRIYAAFTCLGIERHERMAVIGLAD